MGKNPLPIDVRHLQTPTNQRGAEWWLREHAPAEHAVTSAAGMVECATSAELAYFGRKQLDARLDHLEHVEDVCDAIIDEMRKTAPALADMCERYYIKGETWASIGGDYGMSANKAYGRCATALRRLRVATD